MKYTPGPWIDISDGLHSKPPRMALIKTTAEFGDGMTIDATKSGKTFAESCANARLIAAAPHLHTDLDWALNVLLQLQDYLSDEKKDRLTTIAIHLTEAEGRNV